MLKRNLTKILGKTIACSMLISLFCTTGIYAEDSTASTESEVVTEENTIEEEIPVEDDTGTEENITNVSVMNALKQLGENVDVNETIAEDNPYANKEDVRNSLIRVITGYYFEEDASMDIWTEGMGILINKNCVLTTNTAAIISQDSQLYRTIIATRGESYKQFNIDLTDFKSVASHIRTYVVDTTGVLEASVNTKASGDSHAVLDLAARVNSHPTVVLASDAMKEGDKVYATGSGMELENKFETLKETGETFLKYDIFGKLCEIKETRTSNNSEYVDFVGSFDSLSGGYPLINRDQEIVGMITDGSSGRGSAVDIKTIEASLDNANIEYTSVNAKSKQNEEAVKEDEKMETLMSLLEQANAVDRTQYTPESLQVLDEAAAAGQAVVSDADASRNRILKVVEPLRAAYQSLQPIDHTMDYIKIAVCVVLGIALVVFLFMLPKLIKYFSKPKWEREEDTKEKREEKKKTNKKENKKEKQKTPKTKKPVKNLKEDDWERSEEETGVLAGNGATGVLNDTQSKAWLVQKSNGRHIQINKNSFVLGKSSDGTDFQVKGNDTISRTHCKILRRGSEFFVEDLGSLNGTFIDGEQAVEGDQVQIHDGQELMMSDERFVFEQSGV